MRSERTTDIFRRGFTLMELLISMALGIVILGVVSRSFFVASKASETGMGVVEINNKARMIATLLDRDFGGLHPASPIQVDPDGSVMFCSIVGSSNTDGDLGSSTSYSPPSSGNDCSADYYWVRYSSRGLRGTTGVTTQYPSVGLYPLVPGTLPDILAMTAQPQPLNMISLFDGLASFSIRMEPPVTIPGLPALPAALEGNTSLATRPNRAVITYRIAAGGGSIYQSGTYNVGDRVFPTNSAYSIDDAGNFYVYVCSQAGSTSGEAFSSLTTKTKSQILGIRVTDGGIIWNCREVMAMEFTHSVRLAGGY